MKVAIVHDWLTNLGGAERVVEAMLQAYPEADLYTSVYDPGRCTLFHRRKVYTSWIQNWPQAKRRHQLYPVLRRLAFESFDFSKYDVVITSSTAEAKGIITSESTIHISYINTPTRYYWSHYQDYLKDPGFGILDPLVRWQLKRTIKRSRTWDYSAAQRADYVLGNSQAVVERIERYYKRSATVLYPNVDTQRFVHPQPRPANAPENYYLVVSRLIPYKRIDLAVQAARMARANLIVIGAGSELERLRQLAGPQTTFLGPVTDQEVVAYMQHATAFLFPGEEDFGIAPLEASAAGVPVIAFAKGGALETVVEGRTGLFIAEQRPALMADAMRRLESQKWDKAVLRSQAHRFSQNRFISELTSLVDRQLELRSKQ